MRLRLQGVLLSLFSLLQLNAQRGPPDPPSIDDRPPARNILRPHSFYSNPSNHLFPHNLTECVSSPSRSPSLCAHFHAYNTSGCIEAVEPPTAVRCLNESRCLSLYNVPACVASFNFTHAAFNYSHCTLLTEALNATLGGNLTFTNGTGCDALILREVDEEEEFVNVTLPPPPPPLPRFHPCLQALDAREVDRVRDVVTRAEEYTSLVVLALDPHIGPVAGGASVGVCGLGFTQANEAVPHLRCRFTDGRYKVDVPAVHIDRHQLRCIAPDFTRFAVGMPHNVSVEVSTGRGAAWTDNRVPFTYYSSRPSIDAFGRPTWGYEPSFSRAAWQVAFEENNFGAHVEELYPPTGHPLNNGRPSPWDVPADPFHARGASAQFRPVELDTGDRFELAEDLVVRERQSVNQGVEGSWGDRMSFLRAHNRVRDVYRQEVVEAKAAFREVIDRTNNGVM